MGRKDSSSSEEFQMANEDNPSDIGSQQDPTDIETERGNLEFLSSITNRQLKISVVNNKIIPFHWDLAPMYGKLTKKSVKRMDEDLKIAMAGTTNALKKRVAAARGDNLNSLSWKSVNSLLAQTSFLEPMPNASVTRSDRLIKDEMNYFRLDGSPASPVKNEVKTWVTNLIRDPDVLNATQIDFNDLSDKVAQTGASMTDFASIFYKREYHEQEILDVGLLCYPDPVHRYFKLYRLKLKAWSNSDRFLFVQHDSNGIVGELHIQCYKPREEIISELQPSIKELAVKEAEDFFKRSK